MNDWAVQETKKRRLLSYAVIGLVLAFSPLFLLGFGWRGSSQLHTLMEVASTLLALAVGAMALTRYSSRKSNTFLFIGAGFIGTGLLDGYHAIVTSAFFASSFPSSLSSLIPWSWVASRFFLSTLMLLSWLAWRREQHLGPLGRIPERSVYTGVAALTIASFLFVAFFPLPRAYYPEFIFHRPEEFVPALFFLIATAGYMEKGLWQRDKFEHYLLISLIIGLVSQVPIMALSGQLFDTMFDAAHILKLVSYLIVMIGLMINMLQLFRRAEDSAREIIQKAQQLEVSENRLRAILENILDAVITIDRTGIILSVNPATESMFGYGSGELLGRNVRTLTPEPHRSAHDTYITNYLDTRQPKVIGQTRELEGQHRNGRTFAIELTVVEIILDREQIFVGLVRDITQRKESERIKTEFISTVSHELRTPLTSIRGSLGLLHGGAMGEVPDDVKDMIDLALKNTERLINLVNDLLDMEKIESGGMEFHFDIVDMSKLVRHAITANAGYAEHFGIEFVTLAMEKSALIRGDTDRLMQVMNNLLSNAAKFSPENGQVEISVRKLAGIVRVEVEDKGPGIRQEVHGRIFEKFYQADSSDTRMRGGTGLGLNISRTIIDHHDGIIGFDTRTDEGNSGSIFYFEIATVAVEEGQAHQEPEK